MKLSKRASNGVWYVDFRGPGGRRLRASTGATGRPEAEAKAAKIVAAALRDTEVHPGAPRAAAETLGRALQVTYATVWSASRSKREMKYTVNRLTMEIGDLRLDGLDYATLRRFAEERRSAGDSPATINRKLSAISRACTEAYRMGWIGAVPKMPRLAEDNVKERYLSKDEEASLMKVIEARVAPAYPEWAYMAALVPLLLDTGMRLGEALGLTSDNVSGDLVVLRHGTTKSGRGRSVPLTKRARAAAKALIESPLHGTFGASRVSRRFQAACTAAGIEGVTLHTLRHTCASRLVQGGVDLFRVQRWLGHSTPMVTTRYAHLEADDLRGGVAALDGTAKKRKVAHRKRKG